MQLGHRRISSLHPLETDGGRVDEEHRVAGHREMAALPGGSHTCGMAQPTPVASPRPRRWLRTVSSAMLVP